VCAEAEHGEGDEGLGAVEAEGDAGDEADLGVGRLDQGVREAAVEGGVDRRAVLDDASLQGDERFDATTPSPQNSGSTDAVVGG